MVTPATDELKKRKRPPTFAHLPQLNLIRKAKKLKRVWVEKTKIKSKWKAMKRKEGWISGPENHRRREEQEQDGGDEMLDDVANAADEHSDHLSVVESHPEPIPREPELQARPDSRAAKRSAHSLKLFPDAKLKSKHSVERLADPKTTSMPKTRSAEKRPREPEMDSDEDDAKEDKPSLRELTREAYSRASLHTFKADPLKRRRGTRHPNFPQESRGRGVVRGSSGGNGRGARGRGGVSGGRGRDVRGGQPNMKLRMGAMLERIKRDLT